MHRFNLICKFIYMKLKYTIVSNHLKIFEFIYVNLNLLISKVIYMEKKNLYIDSI